MKKKGERERELEDGDWRLATDDCLQFLGKLLKLMRSSYNTFNANQRLNTNKKRKRYKTK